MTLVEFLLARLAEDEERQQQPETRYHERYCTSSDVDDYGRLGPDACDCQAAARVLADCAAKRRIVEDHQILRGALAQTPRDDAKAGRWRVAAGAYEAVLEQLATTYAGHPDYHGGRWS